VWKIVLPTNDFSVSIVPALVDRVMARLADDDAVVERIEASELRVKHVMSVPNLAKRMLRATGFTKARNARTAGGAAEPLTIQSQMLRRRRELEPCHSCCLL
jgi:hypothetical protein